MPIDELRISLISTIIMLLFSLPFILARLLGSPLISLLFETSMVYLPLVVLVLLTLYLRSKSGKTSSVEENTLGSPRH